MQHHIRLFFSGLFYTLGIAIPLGWFGTLVYEHSSYEHYLQVIHDPWIFSDMGSGPVQLWGSILIILIGTFLCLLAWKLQRTWT